MSKERKEDFVAQLVLNSGAQHKALTTYLGPDFDASVCVCVHTVSSVLSFYARFVCTSFVLRCSENENKS